MKRTPLIMFLFTLAGSALHAQSTAPYHAPNENSEYLNTVQQHTFGYFRDFAHPVSAMIPERTATPNVVTSGGTGFGVMAWVTGVYRGWISREEGVQQTTKLVDFLEKAERFHGAWSHWLDGNTGKAVPFSRYDDGGDLVETAYLVNGLLVARAYFDGDNKAEKELRKRITNLYETVEWDWYVRDGLLHWHWSANHGWKMNHPIGGYNECLITYVLAMGSPTHPISEEVYTRTWKQREPDHYLNSKTFQGYKLPLGFDYGGPLFFAHYSYLSLDPKHMQDADANYWQMNLAHTLMNRAYCAYEAPKPFGYSTAAWGLTASDDPYGYDAHNPRNDNGTLSPTAALSSFPYTPFYSFQALRYFYLSQGNPLFGPYGFYDAMNKSERWYSNQYLAIDQGPIVVMIENYRSGLIWNLGAKVTELQLGLKRMGITEPVYKTGFYASLPDLRTGYVDLMRHADRGRYELDYAVQGDGPVSVVLMPEQGTEVVLLNKEKKAPGVYLLDFEAERGRYTVAIRQGGEEQQLKLWLH